MSQPSQPVEKIDLSPQLKRPLQLWNPLDYLLLLYWVFYFPQALLWYEDKWESYKNLNKGRTTGELWIYIIESRVLRRFLLQALILAYIGLISTNSQMLNDRKKAPKKQGVS